jgi:hypothetical protein
MQGRSIAQQVIAPRPKSPPMPNANLRTEGITMTHSALLEKVLGNPIGDVHDFLEHLAAHFEPLLFSALICRQRRTSQEHGDDKNGGFSHNSTPAHLPNYLFFGLLVFCPINKWQ